MDSSKPRGQQIAPAIWDRHKKELIEAYLSDYDGTRRVSKILSEKEGVMPTIQQVKYRFRKWNVSKNLKADEAHTLGQDLPALAQMDIKIQQKVQRHKTRQARKQVDHDTEILSNPQTSSHHSFTTKHPQNSFPLKQLDCNFCAPVADGIGMDSFINASSEHLGGFSDTDKATSLLSTIQPREPRTSLANERLTSAENVPSQAHRLSVEWYLDTAIEVEDRETVGSQLVRPSIHEYINNAAIYDWEYIVRQTCKSMDTTLRKFDLVQARRPTMIRLYELYGSMTYGLRHLSTSENPDALVASFVSLLILEHSAHALKQDSGPGRYLKQGLKKCWRRMVHHQRTYHDSESFELYFSMQQSPICVLERIGIFFGEHMVPLLKYGEMVFHGLRSLPPCSRCCSKAEKTPAQAPEKHKFDALLGLLDNVRGLRRPRLFHRPTMLRQKDLMALRANCQVRWLEEYCFVSRTSLSSLSQRGISVYHKGRPNTSPVL